MALDLSVSPTMSRQARSAEWLDAETEIRLALAWRNGHDEAALHRLVMAYMRLAIAMASRFSRYGAPMNDLVQEAGLGLMRAAEKFDPERGVRFSTYAVWWIKAGIQDYVMRNWSMVRTGSTTAQKSLFFNLKRVQAQLEREAAGRGDPLDPLALRGAVARTLGVSEADVEMMEGRLSGTDLSLNATQGDDEDGREWIEALPSDEPDPEGLTAERHDRGALRGWLAGALGSLPARERYIVTERKLRDEPRTLESLAEELGLSKERVRQLESAAFAKMRRHLLANHADVRSLLA